MTAPRATYRVQLRGATTFASTADLAPYLAKLGVSHCYLSPITTAMPGSTHGYDVIDFASIDPVLGGRDGFLAMAATLRNHGLKIIVDIVPNHMAASPMNGWWHDVLEWGQASPRSRHFDIDWSAPKLLLPVLGTHYADALAEGEIRVSFDRASGTLRLCCGGLDLPLTPPSYGGVLARAPGEPFSALALRFAASSPGSARELAAELAANAGALDQAVAAINADPAAVHALHEQQVWRLAHWRLARENLTYRRFFEIADLVGVRVEEPAVFDDVHRSVLDLVADGVVDGLRIDHVDGLADPLGYLTRLRSAVGEDVYIVVEKILGADEELRRSWPVAGTTGYEFISDLARLFVRDTSDALTEAYVTLAEGEADPDFAVTAAKRRTFNRNLAGELQHLTQIAADLAEADVETRDIGADTLRRAIVEIASAFPVYRTYVDAAGAAPEDVALLKRAIAQARAGREVEDEAAFDFLLQLLTLDASTPERQAAALGFATRFQQTTGPLMAKSLEDTVFYRFNRLIAVNEVGGEPQRLGGPVDAVHASMQRRVAVAPEALSATATHDTKRGEDARARLYAISEDPERWGRAVARWTGLNAAHHREVNGQIVPDPNTEWLYYQSLLGAWPATLSREDAAGLGALSDRLSAFMVKAMREAKLHTSWTRPDADYEAAIEGFVGASLDPGFGGAFLCDFIETAAPLLAAGCVTSLTQVAFKILAPGVPDIYQGTELWDLSLVDPDNRTPVDYDLGRGHLESLASAPAGLLDRWQDGAIKLAVLRATLGVRKRFGAELVHAAYVPLAVEGPRADHVVAFARRHRDKVAVLIGARFASTLLSGAVAPAIPADVWRGTSICCPEGVNGLHLRCVLSGWTSDPSDGRLAVDKVLARLPVAVLTTQPVQSVLRGG